MLIPTGKIGVFPIFDPADKEPKCLLGDTAPFIDHCFVLTRDTTLDTRSSEKALKPMVHAHHPETGVNLLAETTEPSFQFYTGEGVNVKDKYSARAGFCLESSRFVDALNFPQWKDSVLVGKGQLYGSKTKFTVYTD